MAKIKGLSFHDAMLQLAFIMAPTDYAFVRKLVEERTKSPMLMLSVRACECDGKGHRSPTGLVCLFT